ncbi:hypothetical protein HW532_20870 [Kaustia mangrovi]|uniref:Tail tubular protein B n=1 Tax=Kaustia mangrovi TaxID=2593653 RepID=A0A7S8C7N3_9HYPH|nr:hypothetical protein [Kaustia mangrovi]QPC44933.1 hypothetical protein HW532_20870 [Kaustia mangrovi]
MSSDPVTGLTRRSPTDLVGLLGTSTAVRGWQDFETQDGRKFLAFFHDNEVEVFDLNGVPQTVTYEGTAQDYLNVDGNIRTTTTDDDETYVVNTGVVTGMLPDTKNYLGTGTEGIGIIQVLGGAYSRKYTIRKDGVDIATYQTPNGDSASEVDNLRTTYIASKLENKLNDSLNPGSTDYVVLRKEDVVVVYNPNEDFTLTGSDDQGNINLKVSTNTVPETGDLPRLAPHLYIMRIAEHTDPDEDVFFKFVVEGEEDNETPDLNLLGQAGYWQECVAPDTPTTIDPTTMPHVLVYDQNTGEFTFRQEEWAQREAGTTTSNPDPSFIDRTIRDVGGFQGRLAFVAGSSFIASRTDKLTNFFFGSISAQADTDPIDIKSKVENSTIENIVEYNKDLVMFSSKGQFLMPGRTAATPANAALSLTSSFEANMNAQPVVAGANVYFATDFGKYTGIREFFAEGASEINDSRPITSHVKNYIDGHVVHMSTSSNYETLLVTSDGDLHKLYVYQFIWADKEKVQSAWHHWTLPNEAVYHFFDDEFVYIVQKDGDTYYLTRLSLDLHDETGVGYPIYLDDRFDVFDMYDAFQLPYDYMSGSDLVVVQGSDCPNPGLTVPIKSIDYDSGLGTYVVTLSKSMLGGDVVVGTRFASRYRPTMPAVKDKDGVVIATGKLKLKSLLVSLSDTGHISGQVVSKYGDGPVVSFDGRIVGAINNIVGEQPLSDDIFKMPFRQNVKHASVEFFTNSHLPMTMLDIEWVGHYTKRGRRISTGA